MVSFSIGNSDSSSQCSRWFTFVWISSRSSAVDCTHLLLCVIHLYVCFRAATIYSLAFSPDLMFLAASSNTGTIHIFRLITAAARFDEETTIRVFFITLISFDSASVVSNTWAGLITRVIKGGTSYLPQSTTEVFTQDRSFATVHFPPPALKTTIAMNK